MFEEQLELFNQPKKEKPAVESKLEGRFSPAFLAAIRLFLQEKLAIADKDKKDFDLPRLLTELKKSGEGFDAYDQVIALAHYREVAGVSDEPAARRKAQKDVNYEMARLAREFDLPLFAPAYPKLKERPVETPVEKAAEIREPADNGNPKLFRRGGPFISYSHNEEEERK
ncbi:hypothetical protein HGA34_00565 [Candidatus Falkowbacteria bacterium]|nr:hypothetical protein [Candidatus Falkowbacteria bacterium]